MNCQTCAHASGPHCNALSGTHPKGVEIGRFVMGGERGECPGFKPSRRPPPSLPLFAGRVAS